MQAFNFTFPTFAPSPPSTHPPQKRLSGGRIVCNIANVPDCDTNEEAVRQVEKATDSEPVSGEELLESEELKRQLRKAKDSESKKSE